MPFEILHGALVLLRRRAAGEGAEIAPPAGLRIFLARIEPIFARGELADHWRAPVNARHLRGKDHPSFSFRSYSAAWTVLASSATSATI
jgi:hypothetical protein